jgi:signal transduction histidine kinase
MLLGIILSALLVTLGSTSWALSRTFDAVGRAIILDDLGEYSVLYQLRGLEGVRAIFVAGEHESDQLLRVVDATGEVKLEVLTKERPQMKWPDLPRLHAASPQGEVSWHREPLPDGATLTLGRQRMQDGAELWFGRIDAADEQAIQRVHRLIIITMTLTALLALAPIAWFASKVLQPVRALINTAHQLAADCSMEQRLPTTQSIPELREFADAFNSSLDRVQSLTEELEAANDQLAHELRTPLARIRGNVEHCLVNTTDADVTDHAARAVEEIDRATQLVQSILSIRAGDARTMKLNLQLLSFVELVRDCCELYAGSADEKDQDLALLVTGQEKYLLLDAQRIQQAVCNLLDNAINYTPGGGQIEVEVEFHSDHVVLDVRDTGPGLTAADFGRVWQRFMRGSAASASAPGIGLGLSLVRAVVTAHGGQVDASNREGGGAQFSLRLPMS